MNYEDLLFTFCNFDHDNDEKGGGKGRKETEVINPCDKGYNTKKGLLKGQEQSDRME